MKNIINVELLKGLLNNLSTMSQGLKKKSLFVDKPWVSRFEDGSIQKFIFNANNKLILSDQGVVSLGSWDYFPEANSLLMNIKDEGWLFNELFIDENVIILKRDGTINDFFALVNENTLPDLDILKYLHRLRGRILNIKEVKLLNGLNLQIINGAFVTDVYGYVNHKVDLMDVNKNFVQVKDGKYLLDNKKCTVYIKNSVICKVTFNFLLQFTDNQTLEIEEGSYINIIGKTVTINGEDVGKTRLEDSFNRFLYIEGSKIIKVTYLMKYNTREGLEFDIEQVNPGDFRRGDRIISCNVGAISDGKYRLKNHLWRSIEIKNGVVQ